MRTDVDACFKKEVCSVAAGIRMTEATRGLHELRLLINSPAAVVARTEAAGGASKYGDKKKTSLGAVPRPRHSPFAVTNSPSRGCLSALGLTSSHSLNNTLRNTARVLQ